MNLVLLFFFTILIFILILSFIFICSELRLDIRKINISNIDNGIKIEKINKDILIFLEIYLFGKINIFKINLNKNIYDKINPKSKIKNLRYNFRKLELNKIIEKMKIKQLNINASIGTEEVGMTAILVALFSGILGILTRNINRNDAKFRIMPLYNFGNSIDLKFNCILQLKLIDAVRTGVALSKK